MLQEKEEKKEKKKKDDNMLIPHILRAVKDTVGAQKAGDIACTLIGISHRHGKPEWIDTLVDFDVDGELLPAAFATLNKDILYKVFDHTDIEWLILDFPAMMDELKEILPSDVKQEQVVQIIEWTIGYICCHPKNKCKYLVSKQVLIDYLPDDLKQLWETRAEKSRF